MIQQLWSDPGTTTTFCRYFIGFYSLALGVGGATGYELLKYCEAEASQILNTCM